MANSGRFEYTIGFKTDDSGLKSVRKALQEIQKLTVNSPGLKNMDSELAIAKTRAAELETALIKAFNVKLGTTSVTALNKQLQSLDLKAIYKDLVAIGPKGEEAFNKMAAQALKSNIQIKETNTLMKKFGETLWNNISWMVSGSIINSILGVFQQAYGYTKNLDESLNNIRIVTGQGADEMERFAATAQDAAKELGKGTTDYTNAALIFYQQGLGEEETKTRTDIATKIANTSGQSVESAADEMTAVWNGYQVATDELELYGDKMAAVAASTASNIQELATGVSKVASAANTAGVDIDQLNGMLSTVISVTREAPESVGTAFKTIFARIGDLVEDGTDEFGVTLGQISGHLHAMGIDILDEQGKMRDMGEVIEEVGNNWNNYSREQQEAIAIQMAGKRQYTQLIALFSNWDKYTTSLETSQNALGKLQEQQDIFMESVPAKLQQVRTSWEGVYDSVLASDSIGTVADLISGLLEKVESFFDSVGGGLPMLQMLASTMLQIFSDKIGVQLGIAVSNFGIIRERMTEITAEQEIQSRFGAIDNTTTQTLVGQTEQILKYRSAMTKEQQDEFNKLLDEEVEQQTKLKILQEQLKTLEQLKTKWDISSSIDPSEFEGKIKALQNIVKNNAIDGQELFSKIPKDLEPVNGAFGKFKTYVEDVKTKLQELSQYIGGKGPIADLATQWEGAVSQLQQGGWDQELVTRFERMASSINVAAREGAQELQQISQTGTDQLKNQIQQQEQVVQSQGAIFESLVQRLKAQNLGQVMSQTASSIGQVISSIQMLKNIGSIWENDDLSKSEKMLQTVQNLAFTVPMLMNSLKGLTAVAKLFNIEQAKSAVEGLKSLNIELKRDGMSIKRQVERVKELVLQKAQTAGEGAEAGAVNVETGAETANTTAKKANAAATGAQILVTSAYVALVLVAVAVLALAAYRLYKMIQAQEEADEANQKAIDTANELKTKYKELIDSNNELIASFSGYHEVWKQWEEGTATVDELHDSVTSLLDTLDMADDPNIQTALRIAEATGNYDKLNSLIQQREEDLKESILNSKNALVELEKISQQRELIDGGKKEYTVSNAASAGGIQDTISKKIGENAGIKIQGSAFSDKGEISIDFSKMSSEEYEAFTADNGQWIKDAMQEAYENYQSASSKDIKEMASQAYNFYDELYSSVFGAHEDAIAEQEADKKAYELGLDFFKFDADTSQEEVFEQVKNYKDQLKNDLGKDVSWDEAFQQAISISPDASDAITAVQAYVDVTTDALNDKLAAYNNTHKEQLSILTEDDVVTIGQRLDEVGVDLNQLDLSKLDENTLKKIFSEKSKITEETIKAIKEQVTAADIQIAMLDMDFESLGSSMESVGEKIEKGIAPSALSKNKDYQSIIEQAEQLKQIYYGDEGLIDAIDTISKPNLSGTQQFADAWDKVLEKVKSADIDKALDDYEKKLDSFAKDTENLSGIVPTYLTLESGEFIDQMNELTAADYHVDVTVNAAISNSVDKAKDDMKEIVDAASKIGENFIVSVDDLEILNEQFPGILKNMTTLADGSTQLNEAAVTQAKKAAEEQIKIETQEQIFKLDLQNELLKDKAEKYEEMIDLAEQMASGTIDNEEVLKETLAELTKKENEIELINENETLIAEGKMGDDSLNNWDQYYAHLSETDKQFWQQRLKNQQATSIDQIDSITPDLSKSVFQYDTVPNYTPDGFYIGDKKITNINKDNMVEVGKKIKAQYEERKKQVEEQIKKNDDLKKILEATSTSSINSLEAAGKATDKDTKATDKNTDAKDKNKDATDKQSKATAKLLDLLDDEIDAYHDINAAIQQVDTTLSRLEKQQSKLTGSALVNNLQKQNELLEKQKGNYEEKMRVAQMDIELNKQLIQAEGGQFNADGTISNYSELLDAKMSYINALRMQYNSMSAEEQEGFEAVVKQAEEDYKELQENIKNYEQLLLTDLPDLEDKIQEAADKQIEHNIQAWELTFTVRLDTNEAEKQNREFRRKVIDQIKEDDILGNAVADYQDLSYYRNESNTGQIQILTDELAALNKAKAEIESGSGSSIFGDNLAEVESRIKDIRTQLQQAMISEQEAIKNIKDAYLSMIDKAQEKWDEQIEAYNKLSNLINHDMNIIKLLYGEDKSYAMLDQYYKKQNEYNQQQLDMYVKQAALWKVKMEGAGDDPELYKKFKENWENAIEGGKSVLENSIQGVIDTYTNAINEIFKELENKLTNGLGFNGLKENWDFINEESDRYLDSVNSAYAVAKLEKEMQEKIDNTADLVTKQKMTETMNEQLDILKQRDKLTQYDLDRASALFDIEVKRAAFKDAQQNKSRMRLRRDSQGNYSYQFVSDEDSVAQAAQELADAQNSLYNLDKDAYKGNLDEIYNVFYNFTEKWQKLATDVTISDEERRQKQMELIEQYHNSLYGLAQRHENLKLNLQDSTLSSLAVMYNKNVEDYQDMTDKEKDILMEQTVPYWNNAMSQMADKIGSEGLMGVVQETFENLEVATKNYKDTIGDVTSAAESYFGDITTGEELMVTAMQEMIPTNDIILSQWSDMTDKLREIAIESLTVSYGLSSVTQNAIDALDGVRQYDEYQQEKAEQQARDAATKKVETTMNKSNSAPKGLDYNRDDWGEGHFPKIGDKVTYLGGYYFYDSLGTSPLGNRGEGQNKTVTVQNVAPNNPFPVAVMSNDAAYGWLKKNQIAKMDTGGYTGNWGTTDGKIGILHQKELVLNAYDTENFLKAMQVIKEMLGTKTLGAEMLENMNNKIIDIREHILEYSSVLESVRDHAVQAIEQKVYVDAQFPNARDADEILLAFDNLTNSVTQYAHSTKR